MKPASHPHPKVKASAVFRRHPADLKPHRKIAHLIGRWQPDSPSALALRRSIQESGQLDPILITPDGDILDGVTRWQACRALQIDVLCRILPEADALAVALETELHRRHHTKSQLAFRLVPLIAQAFEERFQANRKRLNVAISIRTDYKPNGKPITDYAVEMGVTVRLLEQAHELHELCRAQAQARQWTSDECRDRLVRAGLDAAAELSPLEYFTLAILDEERAMGIGAALTGLKALLEQERRGAAGLKHRGSADVADNPAAQQRLFDELWQTAANRWSYWEGMDAEARQGALQSVTRSFTSTPTDLLEKIAAKAREEIRRRSASETA